MDETKILNIMTNPQPLIVQPKQEHKQTLILLHGRGDRADSFGAGLLNTALPDNSTLYQRLPNAKFVFLQAPLRSVVGGRYPQWFQVQSLRPGSEEDDIQIPELRETIQLVHNTLKAEIELVGAGNVALGGLSQGCASSLASLLLWDGPPFAACVGMSGWMPFRRSLEDAGQSLEHRSTEPGSNSFTCRESITTFAKKLERSAPTTASLVFHQIPIFLGHGIHDYVVVTRLGQEAASCLEAMQAKVTYKEYQRLGHWYSPEMLDDIAQFLMARTGWAETQEH